MERERLQNYYKTSKEYLEVIDADQNINIYYFYCDLIEKVVATGDKILDVGCGSGASTKVISKRIRDVVGLDVSQKFMSRTKTKNRGIDFVAANAEEVPFRDCSFGVVASNSFIEHVPDVKAVIDELLRITKPGGYIVFHGPNLLSPITPIVKACRKMLRQKTSPIFGETIVECFKKSIINLCKIQQRKASKSYLIEYRKPDFSFHGDDADATWFSNPLDLLKLLKEKGADQILVGRENTKFRNLILKCFPNIMGLSIIVQKNYVNFSPLS